MKILDEMIIKQSSLISVIVPSFNEEGNIVPFCEQFDKVVNKLENRYELIFVDDGSTDKTLDQIVLASENYNYVYYEKHLSNRGISEALQTGFESAKGDILVFYPTDLQFFPEDIPSLIEPLFNGYDITTGWKQGKYEKWFVSNVYNYLSRKLFNLKVHDLNSVKAFKANVVKDISLRYNWHRYLIALANNHDNPHNYRVKEVKVPLYPRNWGKSKFRFKRIPGGILDLLAVKTHISLLRKPMTLFGSIGSFFIFCGFITGFYAIYTRYIQNDAFRPILYLVILMFVIGISLFILGVLAEGIVANKEKLSSINNKINSMQKQMKEILNKLD